MIDRPKMLNEREETPAGKILSALCTLAVILLVALTLFNLWFVNNYFIVEVDGDSMNDTLVNGDLLYTRKTDLHAARGDIVIIDVSAEQYEGLFMHDTKRIVKRLIAVEGDCVKCEDGVVWLKKAGEDYVALDEPYAKGVTPDFPELEVKKGRIFFLGDNRAHSQDSTEVGTLLVADIVGIVPDWAVKIKSFSTKWEGNRNSFTTA